MPNLSFRAANSATDQTQTHSAITIGKPTGTAKDDLLDATFVTFIASPAAPPTHTLPDVGWQVAQSGTFTILGGSFSGRITRAYKIAGDAEGADYTFTASANCVLTVDIRAYDNPNTADPFDVASAVTQFTGASALNCPTVTTTTDNALVVGVCLNDGTSGGLVTYTSADLTERTDSSSLWSGDVIQASMGASGAKAVTASSGGAGFTVTVAYNSEVPAPPVVPPRETVSGGFLYEYEREQALRRRRKLEQEKLEEESKALQDKVDREIAELLRIQEAKDEERDNLARLQRLVRQHSNEALQLSDRAKVAYVRALTQANFSALEALDRELRRMLEEEEAAAVMLLLNED